MKESLLGKIEGNGTRRGVPQGLHVGWRGTLAIGPRAAQSEFAGSRAGFARAARSWPLSSAAWRR